MAKKKAPFPNLKEENRKWIATLKEKYPWAFASGLIKADHTDYLEFNMPTQVLKIYFTNDNFFTEVKYSLRKLEQDISGL